MLRANRFFSATWSTRGRSRFPASTVTPTRAAPSTPGSHRSNAAWDATGSSALKTTWRSPRSTTTHDAVSRSRGPECSKSPSSPYFPTSPTCASNSPARPATGPSSGCASLAPTPGRAWWMTSCVFWAFGPRREPSRWAGASTATASRTRPAELTRRSIASAATTDAAAWAGPTSTPPEPAGGCARAIRKCEPPKSRREPGPARRGTVPGNLRWMGATTVVRNWANRPEISAILSNMDNILVVDDERNIRTLCSRVLAGDQIEVHGVGTGKEGLQTADEVSPDLVLLDLRLPDMDGIEVLRALKARHAETAVIIITGFGQIQSAVEAMKAGATDYLEKPFEHLDKLKLAVARALEEVRARREIQRLHRLQEKEYRVDQLIGDSESTRRLRELISKLARSEAATILIHGESGTGKELVARGLHYESARRDFPFMEVNCAAITETLFESELFGHEKGAFTDAKAAKKGLMELADRGTQFREDLFYRLNVIPIHIPPLRERRDDIMPLARHFVLDANTRFHKSIKGFTPDAERLMASYQWPGNVREVRNLIERLVILERSDAIEPQHLPVQFAAQARQPVVTESSGDEPRTLAQVERAYIAQIMQRVESNKSKAAKILGISLQTLRTKLMEE